MESEHADSRAQAQEASAPAAAGRVPKAREPAVPRERHGRNGGLRHHRPPGLPELQRRVLEVRRQDPALRQHAHHRHFRDLRAEQHREGHPARRQGDGDAREFQRSSDTCSGGASARPRSQSSNATSSPRRTSGAWTIASSSCSSTTPSRSSPTRSATTRSRSSRRAAATISTACRRPIKQRPGAVDLPGAATIDWKGVKAAQAALEGLCGRRGSA